MRESTYRRIERQEQRHAPPAAHVAIYDAATGQPINGTIPAAAQVVIFIPDNKRDNERQQQEN